MKAVLAAFAATVCAFAQQPTSTVLVARGYDMNRYNRRKRAAEHCHRRDVGEGRNQWTREQFELAATWPPG